MEVPPRPLASEWAHNGARRLCPFPKPIAGRHLQVPRIEDRVFAGTLNDSKAAQEFAALLRLSLTLEDYASTEKISDLPKRLSTEGAAPGFDPSGDIAYYEPWGNLAVFYKDFRYSSGLVSLGRLDTGVDLLARSHSVQVTFELAQP